VQVTNWRNYSVGTRAALAALSQGSCYFPGCPTPVLVFVGDKPEVNVEIAHIRAAEANGPRFVEDMEDEERNAFENLVLLCVPHHKTVDRDEKTYPIVLLEAWKAQREASGQSALSGLRHLTEEKLDDMLTTALSSVNTQVSEALSRFERVDAESAQLIKQLMIGLKDARRYYGVDPDTVAILSNAARQLGPFEDNVVRFRSAAEGLGQLEDNSNRLQRAADGLRGLEDNAARLASAAESLRGLEDLVMRIERAASRMRGMM
jgi:hypothetical protein